MGIAGGNRRAPWRQYRYGASVDSRAGQRLKGFCRTGLFKRLESSGQAFMQSVERHILRNYVYLHAIEKKLPKSFGWRNAGPKRPR